MDDFCGRVAMLAVVEGGIDAVDRTGGGFWAAIDRDAVAGQDISGRLLRVKGRFTFEQMIGVYLL